MSRRIRVRAGLAAAGLVASAAVAGGAGVASAAASSPGVITTIVGGVGGPALATTVSLSSPYGANRPCGISAARGRLYVAAGELLRVVNQRTDWLTTAAGTGTSGYVPTPPPNGVPAAASQVFPACSTAVDHAGNLLFPDALSDQIRLVAARTGTFYGQHMTAGDLYTVAGDGNLGFGRSHVPATKTQLFFPGGVAVDGHGNLVIADGGIYWGAGHVWCGTAGPRSPDHGRACDGAVLRVVAASSGTFYGRKMVAGDIYTVAGSLGQTRYTGDGGPADHAGLGLDVGNVRVDPDGNLLLADSSLNRIRVVAEKTGYFYGQQMTAGHIYTVAGDGASGFSGDGGPATDARLNRPVDVSVDAHGNLLIADYGNNRIRVVAAWTAEFYGQQMTAGDIYTVAGDGHQGYSGDGGPGTAARLHHPEGVTADAAGNLVICDTGNARLRVVAGSAGTFYRQAMTAGDIYTVAGNGQPTSGYGGPATAAELESVDAVAAAPGGNLVVSDSGDYRVLLSAAHSGTFFGQAMKAGNLYVIAGNGHRGYSGDGGLATSTRVDPEGVAVGSSGNVAVADPDANRIRLVAAATGTFFGQSMQTGHIYTVAGDGEPGYSGDGGLATKAEINDAYGVAADAAGNLVIADYGNARIRVVAAGNGTYYGQTMTAGHIYTVAGDGTLGYSGDGGPAISAELGGPYAITVDRAGNLVMGDTDADFGDNRVRVVAESSGTFYGQAMKAGDIYTVAGDGERGTSPDGTPALRAKLDGPAPVADSSGNLVLTEGDTNEIQVVAAHTGSFYGVQMTAGDIYRIAGNGTPSFTGDGGPATRAELDDPLFPAVDAAGNLVFPDSSNYRVRMISG